MFKACGFVLVGKKNNHNYNICNNTIRLLTSYNNS